MIDTHCHLTYPQFAGRIEQVLEDARAVGVERVITVGTTPADCLQAADLASRYDNVWFAAGIHPLSSSEPRDWSVVRMAARHPRCVAWGELGLDNHYKDPPRGAQDRLLEEELAFIAEAEAEGLAQRPIIVHCREAVDELLAAFRATPFPPKRFVFHCFTGTPEEARMILDFGARISFTGVVTFRNAAAVAEAAKLVPADLIMVETDSPFLSPEPVRKVHPNEPKHVVHVARFVAALRGVDPAEFERRTDANAEAFFGLR